jgi:prepilin-type N-terminal cleavage/methylation domain-containing protein
VVKSAAFTLIELIFAIVIIAISVISLPMMNQSISKGISSSIVQEAIFAAATELNEVTTGYWDDNSFDTGTTNSLARVIDHEGNCENNSSLESFRHMPGHIAQPLHRRCVNNPTITPDDNANSDNTVQSLGDKAHSATNIFINDITDESGYKQKYDSAVEITRPATFNSVSYEDMKKITITITDAEDDSPITSLTTYSANIGEIDYYKKGF